MDNFLLGKSILFNCLEKSTFSEICLQNSIFFCKIAWKMEILWKFACRNRILLPGSTTPQISNKIDATVEAYVCIFV